MAVVFDDLHSQDAQLEQLWRLFNSCWVEATEELAQAEELAHESPSDSMAAHVQMLRLQARRQRALLDEFEQRMRTMRSRSARYPGRY